MKILTSVGNICQQVSTIFQSSFVLAKLTPIKEEEILRQLVQKAEVDHAEIEHDLSIIMIVGEKMKSHIGVTATATRALSENKINIQMMSQGSSEVSIMFVVHKDQEKAAIKALYNAFFGESKED